MQSKSNTIMPLNHGPIKWKSEQSDEKKPFLFTFFITKRQSWGESDPVTPLQDNLFKRQEVIMSV